MTSEAWDAKQGTQEKGLEIAQSIARPLPRFRSASLEPASSQLGVSSEPADLLAAEMTYEVRYVRMQEGGVTVSVRSDQSRQSLETIFDEWPWDTFAGPVARMLGE